MYNQATNFEFLKASPRLRFRAAHRVNVFISEIRNGTQTTWSIKTCNNAEKYRTKYQESNYSLWIALISCNIQR